jgi:7-cyano-7-deazaguanine synthase in queuosine biosynthesis
VQGGHDPEYVGRLVTLAQLAGEMADLEQDGSTVALTLPVVDLSDDQLVDLADDLGTPIHDFWPCERSAEEPCGGCHECIRWQTAFDQTGIIWPWGRLAGTR